MISFIAEVPVSGVRRILKARRSLMWLPVADDRTGEKMALHLGHVMAMWTEEADPERTPSYPNKIKPKWLLKFQTMLGTYTYQPEKPWQRQSEAEVYFTVLTTLTMKARVR